MSDAYQALGEFHDLFMDAPWARHRPALIGAFSGLHRSERILDLGHMTPATRAATFQRLAELLGPGGRGIVTIDAETGQKDAEPVQQERRIGDHRYVARYLPSSDSTGYVSEYAVLDGDRVVRQERFAGTWQQIRLEQLNGELALAGLTAEQVTPGVAVVHRLDGGES